ncbi:MAG: glycosyltransferase, partial [Bacteroidota bacterium]
SLLKAYAAFRQAKQGTVKLILTGQRGWKSEAFFQQLEQHPFRKDILLTGFIEKRFLPELYSHSLALVYPSTYEGFGFPIVEAFSCGTNVICPDNSSLTEVGGLLAYFYPTGEVDRLQAHMQTVYAGGPEVTRRREEALSWVQQFSWNTYAQRLLAALEDLIH